MRYNGKNKEVNYPITLLKGVALSFSITLILIVLLAIILTYTSLSEGVTPVVNSIIMILSIALGSIYMSLKVSEKGWLNGAIVGLLYVIILIILGSAFNNDYKFDSFVLLRIIISVVTGAVGGMIGVNLR